MRIISEGSPTMKKIPLLSQVMVCNHCGCVFEYVLSDIHNRDEERYDETIYEEFTYCPWCSEDIEVLSCKLN